MAIGIPGLRIGLSRLRSILAFVLNVLSSAGVPFGTSRNVLDSNGVSYFVTKSVLNSAGTAYTVV